MTGKTALALLVLTLAAIAGAALWVSRRGAGECTSTVTAEFKSPGGQFMAAVFSRRCGDGETTQVALRRAGSPFAPEDGDVVFVAPGHEPLKLVWVAEPEALIVETGARELLRETHHWRKLGVTVRRVR